MIVFYSDRAQFSFFLDFGGSWNQNTDIHTQKESEREKKKERKRKKKKKR